MIKKYLQQAHDCGFDVIVQFNYCCNARYTGKILDLDENNFCLLQLGESNSMSWIFKIDDVNYIGIYKDKLLGNFETSTVSKQNPKGV